MRRDLQSQFNHVPHVEQYFGLWAMEETRFRSIVEQVERMDLHAHVTVQQQKAQKQGKSGLCGDDEHDDGEEVTIPKASYSVNADGIAEMQLVGAITKYGSSLSSAPGSVDMRRVIRSMRSDSRVKGLMLMIDSPGGMTAGTADLADEISALAQHIPVTVFIEDLGASAAYFIASAASRIAANESAVVGSIGTFMVLQDTSARSAAMGVKVTVVKAGEMKGTGIPGTEITPEQIADVQRTVDGINDIFKSAVKRNRSLSDAQLAKVADGRVHMAAAAKQMGLIDAVGSYKAEMARMRAAAGKLQEKRGQSGGMKQETHGAATFAGLLAECDSTAGDEGHGAPGAPSQETDDMSTTNANGPAPAATLEELQAEIPKMGAEFYLACLEKKMTLAAAHKYAHETQQAALQNRDEEIKKMQAEKASSQAAAAAPKVPGQKALGTVRSAAGTAEDEEQETAGFGGVDAVAAWNAAVAAEMKATGKQRHECNSTVAKRQPELREAYVAEWNRQHPQNVERRQRAAS